MYLIFMLRLILTCMIVLNVCSAPAISADAKSPSKQKFLQGSVAQSELIDSLERLGISVVVHEGSKPGLVVQDVHMGTAAYYKGVARGDAIRSLVQENDHFNLTIERSGNVYQLALKLANPVLDGRATDLAGAVQGNGNPSEKLAAATTQLDLSARNSMLDGGVKTQNLEGGVKTQDLQGQLEEKRKEEEKKLVPYEIELIIDISGSMHDEDGTNGMSKFEWCHNQVRDLSRRLAPYNKLITITTFNRTYETFQDCDPAKVEQIYGTVEPKGGTDLVDPLMSRLDHALIKYSDLKKRVLIAVITDGMPNIPRDPTVVNRAIVDYTHRLVDPNEVKLTFLQIGDTFEGKDFCLQLDDGLVGEGAKYDIVDTETFDELKKVGIVNALIDAILDKSSSHLANADRTRHHVGQPSQQTVQADNELKALQDERKQLEKQLFGK
jgi:hypothetical protein